MLAALAVPVAALLALASTTAANAAGVHQVERRTSADRGGARPGGTHRVRRDQRRRERRGCRDRHGALRAGGEHLMHRTGSRRTSSGRERTGCAGLRREGPHTLRRRCERRRGRDGRRVDVQRGQAMPDAARAPKSCGLGLTAPSAIAVDTSHHADAVYVADGGGSRVRIFGARHCNATRHEWLREDPNRRRRLGAERDRRRRFSRQRVRREPRRQLDHRAVARGVLGAEGVVPPASAHDLARRRHGPDCACWSTPRDTPSMSRTAVRTPSTFVNTATCNSSSTRGAASAALPRRIRRCRRAGPRVGGRVAVAAAR